SVTEQGVLLPLLVRPIAGGAYDIVAGARRFNAAKLAGLREVPVVVADLSDSEALMVALVENLQREDLAPLDEAQTYFRLLDEFGWTQEDMARRVGRSRSHVANTVRLLGLPQPVKQLLEESKLTAGHARALLNAADPAALAERVVAQGLSVRQTEALAQKGQSAVPAEDRRNHSPDPLERTLAERLGLDVK